VLFLALYEILANFGQGTIIYSKGSDFVEKMRIRPAERTDLDEIERIYAYARRFMAQNGNPTQWKNGYPWRDLLEEDIDRQTLYVAVKGDSLCGVFVFAEGEDPTYARIEGGTWLSDAPYGTIHRIASITGGLFPEALAFCRSKCAHIRIDTHADNKPMQHLAEKYGFSRRGIIYVADGTPRIAYEQL